ncbi:MAG: TIGR00282 family metallophosphoesterase [Rhizobiales bacterium]|nr:TIGR00282 family metallophosphoesterase [Hyphomicrobiales bacterium]
MRFLFLGDLVGRAARDIVVSEMPTLRRKLMLDFVIVNGENAAGGFGITAAICDDLFDAGVDAITLGNHSWDQREALVHIEREPRLIRPVNYPKGTPGRGASLLETVDGKRVLVINAMGRVFMDPLDDPFSAVEAQIDACPLGEIADAIVVDFHGEATSEKMAMGHFCDGRASLVVGTHSHVPTADAQVLPGGTAYQTDAGMCGDYNSVIGMEKDEPIQRFLTKIPSGRFQPALGPATMCGVFVETDPATGLALRVEPLRIGGRLKATMPEL